MLSRYLADTPCHVKERCQRTQASVTGRLFEDFILDHGVAQQPGLSHGPDNDSGFTHAILDARH